MEPIQVAYDICRYYLADQTDVDASLVAKIGGFHRSRNLAALASCTCHFDSAYHTVKEWRFLRQVEAFFKKNSAFSSPESCYLAARQTYFDAEQQCLATNWRLEYYYFNREALPSDLRKYMSRMEGYVHSLLGDFHSFMDDLPRLVRVTPGATAHTARRYSIPQLKMRMKLYSTSTAAPYLKALYRYYGFNIPRLVYCDSNRVELVPKNWKTDRTIACEPEGNLPLQLAFDTYAKRRLRRFGIDLRDQSANQDAAKKASIDNGLATVDFKAASDTISLNAVAWVFPPDWFKYLSDVRSPRYRGVFGEGTYHKFSSMGNGSTFTIETILFAAACHAVGSKNYLVYGDDVIIEKELFPEYQRLTRFLGFTINAEKSFIDGPFRESCGLDAFNGLDVTPAYIRQLDRRKSSFCHLVNSIARIAIPEGHLANYLLNVVKEKKLPSVPFSDSSVAGVWIHPATARRLRILRVRNWINRYKAFVPFTKARNFVDSRGYYLWFLNKNSQVLFGGPWHLSRNVTYDETSSVPIFKHKYVRKWVGWELPPEGLPVHLYWWTDFLHPPVTKAD